MAISVRIPTPLRRLTQGESVVRAGGTTVSEVLLDLDTRYPGLRHRLYEGDMLRRFINVYLNDEDIRFLEGEGTPVHDGDLISIVPAIAGGGRDVRL